MTAIADQIKLVEFAQRHPDKWHTYTGDQCTVASLCACANLGIIKVNDTDQFRLRSPEKARQFLAARA